ncbi:MAG: malonic semialdehyde reductase [Myxococcota bacterium]|jgi:3-hydroxypropanoate dehydrogenase|nr:malonic semialdehyde reductase [Myxococcota bacterium]
MNGLTPEALDLLFLKARTHVAWRAEAIDEQVLRSIYDSARMAPTAMNAQPLRVHFVRSPEAKRKLLDCLSSGNVDKTRAAPVTAILAADLEFYKQLPKLAPYMEGALERFAADPEGAERFARMNATLQSAYFIIAARAHGLDCGPMGGFDAPKLDATFFAERPWRSIMLLNLGHGDPAKNRPRAARLDFDEACVVDE